MKIKQEPTYEPIMITLETAEEAKAFIGIVDRVERIRHADSFTAQEEKMLTSISNTFTNHIQY